MRMDKKRGETNLDMVKGIGITGEDAYKHKGVYKPVNKYTGKQATEDAGTNIDINNYPLGDDFPRT